MIRHRPPSAARHHLSRSIAAALAAAAVSLLPVVGQLLAMLVLLPVALADGRRAKARRAAHRGRGFATVGAGTAVGPVTPGRRYRSRAR